MNLISYESWFNYYKVIVKKCIINLHFKFNAFSGVSSGFLFIFFFTNVEGLQSWGFKKCFNKINNPF